MGGIKEDYKALVGQVENINAQVIFSSILLIRETGRVRSRCIVQNNIGLSEPIEKVLAFMTMGCTLMIVASLEGDGIHPSKKGKRIFGESLRDWILLFHTVGSEVD